VISRLIYYDVGYLIYKLKHLINKSVKNFIQAKKKVFLLLCFSLEPQQIYTSIKVISTKIAQFCLSQFYDVCDETFFWVAEKRTKVDNLVRFLMNEKFLTFLEGTFCLLTYGIFSVLI
jgi:hypothetical protein